MELFSQPRPTFDDLQNRSSRQAGCVMHTKLSNSSKAVKVRSVLKQYDSDFDPVGLDESYLDMTEHITIR